MSYTLKTTGLATSVSFCLALDSNGTTIKDFASSDVTANMTVDALVTYGTASWKGVTRGYWAGAGSGSSPKGITFPSGHQPTTNGGDTAFFVALAGSGAGSGSDGWRQLFHASGVSLARRSTTGALSAITGTNSAKIDSTTIPPTDNTTPFSFGLNWSYLGAGAAYLGNGLAFYYGLESGSLALDNSNGTASNTGNVPDAVSFVGGFPAAGTWVPKTHCIVGFNRQLTLTEFQSLHNDWFGTLLDVGTATSNPTLLTLGAG